MRIFIREPHCSHHLLSRKCFQPSPAPSPIKLRTNSLKLSPAPDPAQEEFQHHRLVDPVLDLFDLSPSVAEEMETLCCPSNAGFGDIEDCYYSWSPALFTKTNVAAGQAILDNHLRGVDSFRRLLHNDFPRERYWNGRWRPRWIKDQRCYDEFLEKRIKAWRRTRVLIERLEELDGASGERS